MICMSYTKNQTVTVSIPSMMFPKSGRVVRARVTGVGRKGQITRVVTLYADGGEDAEYKASELVRVPS